MHCGADRKQGRESIDVVYLDFAKAFDKVPHDLLTQKLASHGVDGKVLEWIRKWLEGRHQRVVVNGESSGWADVKSGVPQGSLLGPVLFKIYINDIDLVADLITLLLKFADDTKLAQRIRSEEDRQRLQRALDALLEWAAAWGMQFNAEKCKVMHVGRHNPRYTYKMGEHVLGTTDVEKDIGVQVKSDLKPSENCAKAARTANTVLGQIVRSFHYRDRRTFVGLYKLYVRPHLEFASAAWNPWTRADIDVLEKVQKRAIGMISGMGDLDYKGRLRELRMDTLEDRRKETDMAETFKIMKGLSADPAIWFVPAGRPGNERVTRLAADPLNVRIPAARLDLRKNFFSVRVCESWNALPSDIKNSANVKQFKMAYRQFKNGLTQAT